MPESQQPRDGRDAIVNLIRGVESVLDVGAGDGKWGRTLSGVVGYVDAIEVWPPTAKALTDSGLYHLTICYDAREFEGWDPYDAIILGDVLEHLPRADAVNLVNRLKRAPGRVFLTIPVSRCTQCGLPFGNPFETHLDQWDHYDLYLMGWRLLHVGTNEEGSVLIGTYELMRGVPA